MCFLRHGLILGREAFHGIEDDGVVQDELIIGPCLIGALGQTDIQQRREEKVASEIASEGPAGAIGSLLARSQADDDDAAERIAECRHRGVPPVWMLGPAFLAQSDEARAERAIERSFRMSYGALQRHA